jgi:hypothetical protein
VSGSYAYVTAHLSDSLVVVDISNPASPVIRGSVVSASLLNGVRVRPGALRARMASGAPRWRPHRPSCSRPRRHRMLKLSHSLSRAVLTGLGRRRERLVRLRDGGSIRRAGGGRREQPCVSSHPRQCGIIVSYGLCACGLELCTRGWPRAPRHASALPIVLASAAPPPADSLSRSRTRPYSQASGLAVSGSYAYVAGRFSNSLVVVDVSNPASPVIRGSVVSSSLLEQVRATRSCDRD